MHSILSGNPFNEFEKIPFSLNSYEKRPKVKPSKSRPMPPTPIRENLPTGRVCKQNVVLCAFTAYGRKNLVRIPVTV